MLWPATIGIFRLFGSEIRYYVKPRNLQIQFRIISHLHALVMCDIIRYNINGLNDDFFYFIFFVHNVNTQYTEGGYRWLIKTLCQHRMLPICFM
jgi:hypothetical protein